MSYFVSKLVALLALPVLLMIVLPATVFAAEPAKYFQAAANSCPIDTPGVFNLGTAFEQAGKSYNCIWFEEGSLTLSPALKVPDGTLSYCPAGQPMMDSRAYGMLCVTGYPAGAPLYGQSLDTATTVATNIGAVSNPIPSRAADLCDSNGDKCCTTLDKSGCPITKWTLTFINVLSGIAGITIVIMIVVGGIQYASSADDPGKVTAAKKRIFNALFALVSFIFMYAFLQWIVPGGVF